MTSCLDKSVCDEHTRSSLKSYQDSSQALTEGADSLFEQSVRKQNKKIVTPTKETHRFAPG